MKQLLLILFLTVTYFDQSSCDEGYTLNQLERYVKDLRVALADLSAHVMMEQMIVDERVRTEGDSGIKVVRGHSKGINNYDSFTHISEAFMNMHDNLQYKTMLGLAELTAVLNGVDFRTRHIDYQLVQPSTTSKDFLSVEPIPFPEVPPSVTEKATVDEQIAEMQEWFKAFQAGDPSVRNYTQYFKPVLCYMEGFWSDELTLHDAFYSPTHQLDASSWEDLIEKVRFTTHNGHQQINEDLAFLPTAIMSVNDTTGEARYAQWNYRVLCKPIEQDIPFDAFHQTDDLSYRVRTETSQDDVFNSRAARFKLYQATEGETYQLLDDIFYTVPGLDNIPGDLTQITIRDEYMYDSRYTGNDVLLNTGYYHRWYDYNRKDAENLFTHARCYNDENCWIAQTTQGQVSPMVYGELIDHFSYAIPLEIVYLTPLLSWNPYNLNINTEAGVSNADGRDGTNSPEGAFDGVDDSHWYLTPVGFFNQVPQDVFPFDTGSSAYVLDTSGGVQQVAGAGTRILVDVGGLPSPVRLRWPIAPIHGEGSSVWKELNALKFERLLDKVGN